MSNNENNKYQKDDSFSRPRRLDPIELKTIGPNPFEKDYCFRGKVPKDKFRIGKSTIHAAFANREQAEKLMKGEFELFFLEDKLLRVYIYDQGYRNLLYNMTSKGRDLLHWVMIQLPYGEDRVMINRQELSKKFGMKSDRTIRAGIKELIANRILAPFPKPHSDYYFVNAQYLFQGNRGNYFPAAISEDGLSAAELREPRKAEFLRIIAERSQDFSKRIKAEVNKLRHSTGSD